MNNTLRTFILLAGLTALFVGLGYLIGGAAGMVIALVLAGGLNLFSYWNADKIVLKMYRAQPVGRAPQCRGPHLCRRCGADGARCRPAAPDVYRLIAGDQPNAFATGRNPENAAVGGDQSGFWQMLDRREVPGGDGS